MENIDEKLQNAFTLLTELYASQSREDKAQYLLDCALGLEKGRLKLKVTDQILFTGFADLIKEGERKRWQPSYLIITINAYQRKDINRVIGRLQTFAKRKGFGLTEINAGEDQSDTYFEIQTHSKNKWVEYKLTFENYIDNKELFEFLHKFSEIRVEK